MFLKRNGMYETPAQGIVCECCKHSCTTNELNEYCAKRRRRRSVKQPNSPFYTKAMLKNFTESVSSARTLKDLAESPFVQALNQQKIKNIQRAGNSKRSSVDWKHNWNGMQDAEDLVLDLGPTMLPGKGSTEAMWGHDDTEKGEKRLIDKIWSILFN